MTPVFTLSYSEYKVAEELRKSIKGSSIWITTSSQEKGIDLLLYKRVNDSNKFVTIQVKSSRSYKSTKYNNYFWLNRFAPNPNADFFAIIGIYPDRNRETDDIALKDLVWKDVILIFSYKEICELLENAVTKKDNKPDNMWAFAFNNVKNIYLARGKNDGKEITNNLLKYKLKEIEDKINEKK